ncbi:MAG TPA: hypothetical protein VJ550_03530 [Geomonas sp.]|nr:hypothetical protein [Geomonas sp.]
MMRLFGNLFLLLFFADGGISFLDQLVSLFFPLSPLAPLQHLAADLVVLMAPVIYLCLGIDRRLPKRVFLPLIVFVFACLFALLLVPSLSGSHLFGLAVAAAQLALCLLPWKSFRKGGAPSLTMPPEMFQGPSFSTRNTVSFAAVNLLVLPCFLVLLLAVTVNAYMVRYTSGFMHLAADGLHMSEKVYRRGNQTIRLAGMIHVGEKDYYEKVVGSAGPGRTLVLAEGVSDSRELLQNRPDYGKLAGYLGLTTQQDRMHFKGRAIDESELDRPQPVRHPVAPAAVDILRADVDISSFQPVTVWFLDTLGKQMNESPSLSKQLLSSIAWSEKNVTPAMQETIIDDILYRRNEVVIGQLRKALGRYDNVVVPWGALHMPAIEQEVVRQGFVLQQVRDRVSIRFSKRRP